jgi:NTE family protein
MKNVHKIGLVLSGGGARGAYELGVLKWIAEHKPEVLAAIRVLTGSSVGAVNAAYLASHGVTPEAVSDLVEVWRGLRMSDVLDASYMRMFRILGSGTRRLFGRSSSPATGIFKVDGLRELVETQIDWDRLHARLESSELDALAVAATDIATGGTHLFVHHSPDLPLPRWPHDRSMIAHTVRMSPHHVLASTSLPLLFSPVEVEGRWYTDGGIRQNTPLSPALRLGANRLLVISLGGPDQSVDRPGIFPGIGQLIGKLLNSLFLDRMRWDLDRLDRINDVLDAGTRVFGETFVPRIQEELGRLGRRPYAQIPYVNIKPQGDIGQLAARLMREIPALGEALSRPMKALLTSDNMAAADAASYLLFDGRYGDALIEEGYRDAAGYGPELDALIDPSPLNELNGQGTGA